MIISLWYWPRISSSSSVSFIFQAFSEIPDLYVWYGPDTYMGANIMELFRQMTEMSNEEIANIHPNHNIESIKSLIPRLRYFQVNYHYAQTTYLGLSDYVDFITPHVNP